MTPEERQLITGLFDRMRSYGSPDKDREAETTINEALRTVPDAPYMLVQSVLAQEHALQETGKRIQELEQQVRNLQGASQRASFRVIPWRIARWGTTGIAAELYIRTAHRIAASASAQRE